MSNKLFSCNGIKIVFSLSLSLVLFIVEKYKKKRIYTYTELYKSSLTTENLLRLFRIF